MHARQMAWLGVVPNKATRSRAQRAEDEGLPVHMPPPADAGHLLGYLFEVGPVSWAGMGEVPITHSELLAWQHNTGIELQAWEARALRQLSAAYVDQLGKSRDPACPPPWAPQLDAGGRDRVHDGLKRALSAMASSSKQPGSKHARRRH